MILNNDEWNKDGFSLITLGMPKVMLIVTCFVFTAFIIIIIMAGELAYNTVDDNCHYEKFSDYCPSTMKRFIAS